MHRRVKAGESRLDFHQGRTEKEFKLRFLLTLPLLHQTLQAQ